MLPSNGGYKDDSRPKPAQQVNFMPILGNKNKVSIVDQSLSPHRKVKIDNSIRPRQLKDFANAKVYAKMLRE